MFAPFFPRPAAKVLFGPLLLLSGLLLSGPLVRGAVVRTGVAFQGVQGTVAIGLGIPHGTAVDSAGNVYVTDLIDSQVLKIPRASTASNCTIAGSCTRIGSGFVQPTAVAVDGSGNVYVVDGATQSLYKLTASGTQTILAAGLVHASGVAVAADGTVYVAVSGSIARVTAAGMVSTFASGPAQPGGIALATSGNVYVADVGGNRVLAITPVGGQIVIATGLSSPQAVALDGGGNLYIADTGNNRILSVPSSAVASVCPADCTIASASVNSPGGLSADMNGSLYIADTGNQQLIKVTQDADFGVSAVNATGSVAPTALTLVYQLFGSSCAAPPAVNVLTRGTAGKDFAYNASENACTHAATDSLAITVRFAALSPGLRRGSVQLTDSTGIPQVATYLHGIGTGPQITWTPGVVSTALANSAPTPP